MMKRTVERVLAWIGIGLQLLGVIVLAIFLPLFGNGSMKDAMIQSMMESDSTITYENGEAVINMLSGLVTAGLVLSIILLIIAIIGAVLIGKKAKAAGHTSKKQKERTSDEKKAMYPAVHPDRRAASRLPRRHRAGPLRLRLRTGADSR